MYICICSAQTEKELRNKIKLYSNVQEFLAHEIAGNVCQSCLDEIEQLFELKEK